MIMKDLLGFPPLLFVQCGGMNSVEFWDVEVILTVILPARASISVWAYINEIHVFLDSSTRGLLAHRETTFGFLYL